MNVNLKSAIAILYEISKTDSRALEALEFLDLFRHEQADKIRKDSEQRIKDNLDHTERIVVMLRD